MRAAPCNSPFPRNVFLSHVRDCFSSQVLGGIEPSLYRGDIWYTPIKEEWYYQIEILKLEIGGQSLNLDCREVPAPRALRARRPAWARAPGPSQLGPARDARGHTAGQSKEA